MKLVVTAKGETLESSVDQRLGRAQFFVLYDTETAGWSAHDNRQNLSSAQGAGIQAAQRISELGADVVLTGHCGPKAFAVLEAAHIAVCTGASGTVKEAFDTFAGGDLHPAAAADVDGHHGSI